MAKKIRFPLEMDNGIEVRNMEELREHFSLAHVLRYIEDGKLSRWLRDRYENELADKIDSIDSDDQQLAKKVSEIFEVPYDEKAEEELEKAAERVTRLEKLKQFTEEECYASVIDHVAFDQDELYDLLDASAERIYLCGERFSIPLSKLGVTYTGINHPVAVIDSKVAVDWEQKQITLEGVVFDEKYQTVLAHDEEEKTESENSAESTTEEVYKERRERARLVGLKAEQDLVKEDRKYYGIPDDRGLCTIGDDGKAVYNTYNHLIVAEKDFKECEKSLNGDYVRLLQDQFYRMYMGYKLHYFRQPSDQRHVDAYNWVALESGHPEYCIKSSDFTSECKSESESVSEYVRSAFEESTSAEVFNERRERARLVGLKEEDELTPEDRKYYGVPKHRGYIMQDNNAGIAYNCNIVHLINSEKKLKYWERVYTDTKYIELLQDQFYRMFMGYDLHYFKEPSDERHLKVYNETAIECGHPEYCINSGDFVPEYISNLASACKDASKEMKRAVDIFLKHGRN